VYFIPAETSAAKLKHPAQIWTQNQPEDARYWFPSFDFPSDKATSEALITVQKGETVIGNGELVDTRTNADRTVTFHYRMDVPHSTYLTSFVVGDYVRVGDTHRTVPLGYYVYRDRRSLAGPAFSRTKEMMAAFESVTGVQYPFKKYDQIMVAGFQQFSGMENITATTLADAELLFAQYSFGKPMVEDLVAHELAHSWFGNNVTCRNWSELWLNEGFATFFEAVSRERLYGRDSYMRKLKSDLDIFLADEAINKNRHALQNRLARADDSLFDATTYQKGALVIHMLRSEIGDDAFWKGVNLYLSRHRFDSVISTDLQAAMESAAGRDLKWFFDQWVYAAGSPRLEIAKTYDASAGVLNVSVAQVQKDDGITPSAFRLPLDLEIATPSGPVKEKVEITKRQETFAIKVPGAPTGLTVDAAEKIVLKTVKID
jgi:aminopeptidase N